MRITFISVQRLLIIRHDSPKQYRYTFTFLFFYCRSAPPFPPLNNSRYPVSFALPSTFAVGQRYAICLKLRLLPYAKYMVPFSLLIVSSSLCLPQAGAALRPQRLTIYAARNRHAAFPSRCLHRCSRQFLNSSPISPMRLRYVRMANFSFSTCGFLLEAHFCLNA